jgi:starch phosphorylase
MSGVKGTIPWTPSQTGFELRRKASYSQLYGESDDHGVARAAPGEYSSGGTDNRSERIWQLMATYLKSDIPSLQVSIVNHIEYTLACTRFSFSEESAFRATALSVRDRLIESYNDTNQFFHETDTKRGYYLSMEFLVGRYLQNAIINLDLEENYREAVQELGYSLEALYSREPDPALGNGGLGRLAACFLDSMATLNLPCWGYGLRYSFGIFEQVIKDGRQIEIPDFWLSYINPFEICRPDVVYAVRFYGHVRESPNGASDNAEWVGGTLVAAVAYDNIIPGFDSFNCINLRLWKSEPSREFDFDAFNQGRYSDALRDKEWAESLTAVLYPNDNTDAGKELRLRQQYFFVCASMQDILRRFKRAKNRSWDELPDKIAVQLNDTHPSLAIPEMMRLLVDVEGVEWARAWSLTRRCFNYTNHTVMAEALEKWSADMLGHVLPRHLQIINRINFEFLQAVAAKWGWNSPSIARMSLYQEGDSKKIRMANLCVIGSTKVNGVAAIHTEIVKKDVFPDFYAWFGENGETQKFINMTNGVTPRRWIHAANKELSTLMSQWLGSDEWLKELSLLQGLVNHKDNPRLQAQWGEVKQKNKRALARWVKEKTGVELNETSLFDIQVKRIHEYKRQLLNALYVIHRYLSLKAMTAKERQTKVVPRSVLIGGKAAPGYYTAKSIIKLFNNISQVVNSDPDTNVYLKVVFLPNYNVSNAQIIIPASDLSQHISTAGTEASGTSNMKFVMNGGLIIGTMDGANVEIREECGSETMFIFGALEHEVEHVRAKARAGEYPIDPRLEKVFNALKGGMFSLNDIHAQREFEGLVEGLTRNGNGLCSDHYVVCHDFPSYCEAQARVDNMYLDKPKWLSMSIQSAACSGKFSTDRTIAEYASKIWGLTAMERPAPAVTSMSRVSSHDGLESHKNSPNDKGASSPVVISVPPNGRKGK